MIKKKIMSKLINFFDFFSQTPSLRINGEYRPFSIFGSIIGFLTITFLIGGISIFLNDYFSHLSFNVNSYTDNLAKPNIDLKNFKLAFLLVDLMGREYPDKERLFKITAKYADLYIPLSRNTSVDVNFIDIPIIKCDEYKKDELFSDKYGMYSEMWDLTCLDFSKLEKNLKGVYGNFGK